ncbi:hypothetical protein F8O01_12695 [Pseudoclavibacter chungangensis]|uniref:Uncharacterized protein n=1 Tax=Pseudoclavibacter chungangensis TaxID=587635 RepID=A0A7J5BPM0_9MICO|nr:hypothetical protein [Pseudoclavibacter chungangensis]KAB1655108.1 hypothetical protein F8O01_12695 [Pseudoclavibacter chungangensis]NYJ66120.1 lysylphosphatidylglycerol synthetase-like protein (DUF2156 family) [Pseudoclavibacter chungangensis]
MELMFAGLFGIVIGLAARYTGRHRERSGAVLVPAVGGITALLVWEGLTWLSVSPGMEWLAYDAGWIWWITLGVTVLVTFLLALSIGTNRKRDDDELLDRLSHLGRAAV